MDTVVYEYPEGVFHCLVCGRKLTQRQAVSDRCPNGCSPKTFAPRDPNPQTTSRSD